jgi:hypothetical protein
MHPRLAELAGEQSRKPFAVLASVPAASPAPAPGFAATSRQPGAFLYIHAGVRSRSDCQSVAELVADGWTVEHINQWGGALCRLELNAPAHATGHAVRNEPPIRPADPGMRRKEVPLPLCAAILAVLVFLDGALVAVAAWEHLETKTRAELVGVEASR